MTTFTKLQLSGADAAKFLQGQLTINVAKIGEQLMPCAIADLKGRVQFGLWVYRTGDDFILITPADMATALMSHIKKYGAFSKFTTTEPMPVYPYVIDDIPTFSENASLADFEGWAATSIMQGNVWITSETTGLFQPQELRLHQRGGVDYDKGCYLGQEVIARLYFKASPKAYLHRIKLTQNLKAGDKLDKVQVVNIIPTASGFEALVVGSPEMVASVGEILPLPTALMGGVERTK